MDNIKDRARLRRRKVKGNAAHTHRPIIRYSSFREEARNDDLPHGFSSVRHTACTVRCTRTRLDDACESSARAAALRIENARILLKNIYIYAKQDGGRADAV